MKKHSTLGEAIKLKKSKQTLKQANICSIVRSGSSSLNEIIFIKQHTTDNNRQAMNNLYTEQASHTPLE